MILPDPIVDARNLVRTYVTPGSRVQALRGVDLAIASGQFLAVMGPSGSGKSTLMHILGCLDRPTGGTYRLGGEDVSALNDTTMSQLRSRRIGFVFQTFNLIPHCSVLDNVALPFLYQPEPATSVRDRVGAALERVGLADRRHHRPAQLSGGEMQRVAIARALVSDPALILADEPTGNLDSRTSGGILDLLHELHERGATLVVVTHDRKVAEHSQRIIHLHDGLVEREEALT
ncbi:MAG: ABC transporter ATP-binding protein [Phycisphaerae bacterium]|nr:ABC transporter ATP-binding protein [Phycisphaerae bacterium]